MSAQTITSLQCEVPVFFATSEGQTRRIAERIAAVLCRRGHDSRPIDLASPAAQHVDWSSVRGAIVGASLHMQRHQAEARRFVTRNAAALSCIPSGFVSVSLSAGSLNPDERAAAQRLAELFPAACKWTPSIVLSVAGRLAYTQYGFITRLLMKRIARKEGAPTDTSRDYEFTDWEKVDTFALALDGVMQARAAKKQIAAA